MKNKDVKTYRIDKKTREYILSDFWLFEKDDLWKTASSFKPKDYNYHAAALCLYTSLIFTGIVDDIEKVHPDFQARAIKARQELKELPKYSGLPKKQFHAAVNQICLQETRNCFAHGMFEILPGQTVESSYFVLTPSRTEITNDEKIYVSFANAYNAIANWQKDRAFEFLENDDCFTYSTTHQDEMLHKIIMPSILTELADFYAGKITKLTQKAIYNPQIHVQLNNILLTAQLSYNQNEYYTLFGPNSEVFKAVSYVRNSFLHNFTAFADNGNKQVLENHYKNRSSSIESDIYEISLKLEILKAEKDLMTTKPDSNEIDNSENILKKEASIDELIKMLSDTFVSTHGEEILELANNYEVPNTFEYEFPKKPEKDEKTPDKK